jgi:transcriptional regulator with XRE-family HTH domain
MSIVAPKLRAALERAGITARDLAGRIDMDESTVSLWLSGGRTPRMKNLQKVADALGIELATLWAGPEATPATEVQAAMIDEMGQLSPAQQEALLAIARTMRTPT